MSVDFFRWAKQKETWSEDLYCIRCTSHFQELGNIGKWQCTFHPGQKVDGNPNNMVRTSASWVRTYDYKWSCCDRIWTENHENGCKSCDHSANGFGKMDDVKQIPRSWLKDLKPLESAIISQGGTDSERVNIKRTQ